MGLADIEYVHPRLFGLFVCRLRSRFTSSRRLITSPRVAPLSLAWRLRRVTAWRRRARTVSLPRCGLVEPASVMTSISSSSSMHPPRRRSINPRTSGGRSTRESGVTGWPTPSTPSIVSSAGSPRLARSGWRHSLLRQAGISSVSVPYPSCVNCGRPLRGVGYHPADTLPACRSERRPATGREETAEPAVSPHPRARLYIRSYRRWWGGMELHHRPTAYQTAALTAELPPHEGRLIRDAVSMRPTVPRLGRSRNHF